jgi:hypothetical protein
MQVGNFIALSKMIAEYDLWEEMEQHLRSRGCTEFLISGELLRGVSSKLKRKIRTGALPRDLGALYFCDSATVVLGNLFGTGKTRPTAPEQGGGVMAGGTTVGRGGSPDGGTDGGAGGGGDAGGDG